MPLSRFAFGHSQNRRGYFVPGSLRTLGGLNEDENPQALRPTDLRVANNCARKGSMTGTRPGLKYGDLDYPNAITGTPAIQGMFEYVKDKDATRKMVVVAGGNVYIDTTSGALDKSATTISSGQDNRWVMTDFQDKVFAAGGANGDGFWYWDGSGTAPGVLGNINLGFDVKYVFAKWNTIFVAGMDGTTFDDNPLVARYCDYATDATDPTNWKQANVIPGQLPGENFGVGSYGSEFSTGFGEFQDNRGDFLLMLTNKRIIAFTPNPNFTGFSDAFKLSDTIATGCVGQDAFVDLGVDVGDAVYMSRDGIHSLAQSQQFGNAVTQYLSWPIRKTFASLNRSRLKYASGAYWPDEGVVLFAVATGSNTHSDLILCMDIKNASRITPDEVRWYKWFVGGANVNLIRPIRGADGKPYPYVGGTLGEVTRFESGQYSDLGTNGINVEIKTKDDDFGLGSREKTIGDTYISLQGAGDYSITYSTVIDDGKRVIQSSSLEVPSGGDEWGVGEWSTAEWGDSESIIRHRVPGIGSSPTIAHKFAHSAVNEPFWVGMIDQEVMVSGASDDATANVIGA